MDDATATAIIDGLDEAYEYVKTSWQEHSDIPYEAALLEQGTHIVASGSLIKKLMRQEGKSNREICAALGVRYTEDVPHPVEHIRFGRRLRSHKANRLMA